MDVPATQNLVDLLQAVPLGDGAKQRVLDLMRGFDRFYHGVDHIALLWLRHRAHATNAGFADSKETRLIACAILFHDCIYAADRRDSEERSAEAWLEASGAAGLEHSERIWVADTIRATRDHLSYDAQPDLDGLEQLRLWLLDLDLTPLGEAPDIFDRNVELLRAEAPHLSTAAFETARLSALRRFSAAPMIYRTLALAERFESPARRNLARHLGRGATSD